MIIEKTTYHYLKNQNKGDDEMKIGELNMRCGECSLIDHCGEPYSYICICNIKRFENIDEETFLKLIENSTKKSKKAKINDVYKKIKEM